MTYLQLFVNIKPRQERISKNTHFGFNLCSDICWRLRCSLILNKYKYFFVNCWEMGSYFYLMHLTVTTEHSLLSWTFPSDSMKSASPELDMMVDILTFNLCNSLPFSGVFMLGYKLIQRNSLKMQQNTIWYCHKYFSIWKHTDLSTVILDFPSFIVLLLHSKVIVRLSSRSRMNDIG